MAGAPVTGIKIIEYYYAVYACVEGEVLEFHTTQTLSDTISPVFDLFAGEHTHCVAVFATFSSKRLLNSDSILLSSVDKR